MSAQVIGTIGPTAVPVVPPRQGPELLTVEEVAERLKVGRSTLFSWMKSERLVAGRHYLRIGRIVRFLWSEEVLLSLHEEQPTPEESKKPKREAQKPRTQGSAGLNWDY
jgi:excisionase family DNA binding protein